MAKFTKRHYEAIADVFADAHHPGTKTIRDFPLDTRTLHHIEGELSRLFAMDSPRFDKKKFYGRIDRRRG